MPSLSLKAHGDDGSEPDQAVAVRVEIRCLVELDSESKQGRIAIVRTVDAAVDDRG